MPTQLTSHTGAPHLEFVGAMQAEHCTKSGCDDEFTTSNYSITTTPKREWRFVVEMETAGMDMRHGRRAINLEELSELDTVKTAKLCRVELISVVLYTGPMVRRPILECIPCEFCFIHPWLTAVRCVQYHPAALARCSLREVLRGPELVPNQHPCARLGDPKDIVRDEAPRGTDPVPGARRRPTA